MEDADGEEMVILVESANQHVVAMNADGVKVTDGAHGHEVVLDGSGITVTDGTNSGNKLTMAGGGLTLEDANDLALEGIFTMGDLGNVDPLIPIGGIPLVRLREFRAKARLVMEARVPATPYMALAHRSVSAVLAERPEALAESLEGTEVSAGEIARLQDHLSLFQVAMDDTLLQQTTLGDLLGS